MFAKSAVFTKVCWFFFYRKLFADTVLVMHLSWRLRPFLPWLSVRYHCLLTYSFPFMSLKDVDSDHFCSSLCLQSDSSILTLIWLLMYNRRGLRSLECPWRSEWKINCLRPHQAQEETHIRKQTLSYSVFLTYNNTLRWGLGGRCESQLCPLNV